MARDAFIVGNVVRRNPTGIIVEEGTGTIARNFVTDNPGAGINWNFSAAGTIRDNFVARNGYGITLHQEEYRANPVIERNLVVANQANGIHGHWAGRGSLVTRNLVYGNGGSGIHATGFAPCPESARQLRVAQRTERHHRRRGVHARTRACSCDCSGSVTRQHGASQRGGRDSRGGHGGAGGRGTKPGQPQRRARDRGHRRHRRGRQPGAAQRGSPSVRGSRLQVGSGPARQGPEKPTEPPL